MTEQGKSRTEDNETTHFGFRDVATEDKSRLVKGVFDSVAAKYDLMNDLMSFGIHRAWKQMAIRMSNARAGQKVLDLAGGTGDMSRLFRQRVGDTGQVILSDINASMLSVGRDRLLDEGTVAGVDYAQIDAEKLPFADNQFDVVCISFGLRNVTHKDHALADMRRVLKPGGCVIVLEFSKPHGALLQKGYDAYSFRILPFIGKLVVNDSESYRYLAESIRMHPDQETLLQMMEDAGLEHCSYHNMTQGVVAIHRGYKF